MTMASFNFLQIVELLNCVYCLVRTQCFSTCWPARPGLGLAAAPGLPAACLRAFLSASQAPRPAHGP